MRVPNPIRMATAIALAGLLLTGAAPIFASEEQVAGEAGKESDDERDDAPQAAPEAGEEGAAGDPAFNTLEDIVRMRAAAAVLLARCRPAPAEAQPLTIAWREIGD